MPKTDDLNTSQAAEELGVSLRTIQVWVQDGEFPNSYKLNPGRRNAPIRIPRRDFENFQERRNLISVAVDDIRDLEGSLLID